MQRELEIGQILKPQGIRGELKVKPFTDGEETFRSFKRVFIDGAEYRILSVRCGGGFVYLGLRGVVDRNAAELLRGKILKVPRDEAPEPEEGRYYIADLIGCDVVTEAGKSLGKLVEVVSAATDIYTLEREGETVMFPTPKGVILSVDTERGVITVDEAKFHEVSIVSRKTSP